MERARIFLTADEAIELLPDGDEYVHSMSQPGAMLFLGCDLARADVEATFRAASKIEIGGENCKAMEHPLVVVDARDRMRFFAADMGKVEAFEARRATSPDPQP